MTVVGVCCQFVRVRLLHELVVMVLKVILYMQCVELKECKKLFSRKVNWVWGILALIANPKLLKRGGVT